MTDPIASLRSALADRYRIERELGQGGMATVYLAEDLKHRRQVALKVLRAELAAILGAERFLQEIQVTANLQHPNILPLYDSGEAGGRLYYVMPYVEGESLADRLKREKQLGVDESVRIVESVAAALQYAHEHGVIHRDIKPANILLQSGQALVADFGIALAVRQAGGARLTETGLSLGTPHYMSPEQATGDRELDARSDVYSLGAVLYEMLAGDPPHLGSTVQAIVAKVLSEPPAALQRSRPSVPAHVDAAVQQALAKIPADRFTTAAAFGAALANPSFTGAMTGSRPTGGTTAIWRNPVTLGLAAATLALGVLAFLGWNRGAAGTPVLRYQMTIPDSVAIVAGPTVLGQRIALSPDGSRMVYVGPSAASGHQLWLRERDQLEARPIPGTASGRRPFFSPDGTQVGFFTSDGALRAVGLTGEPPRVINASDALETGHAGWAEDGHVYAASRTRTADGTAGLIRFPVSGGPAEPVTVPDSGEGAHLRPSPLPGDKGVLFVVNTGGGGTGDQLAVVDLRSGKHRVLVTAVGGWYLDPGYLLYLTADGNLVAVPFDEDRLEITGQGRVVVEGIPSHAFGTDLALSRSGAVMYLTGASGFSVRPAWVTPEGAWTTIDPDWTFSTNVLYSSLALSPDGRRAVVSQEDGSGQHLWVKELPRRAVSKLTLEGSVNARASWDPDGRRIVFISNRNGVNQAWRQVADGSAPAELLSAHGANEALITPDRMWLVFRGLGGNRHVYAIRTEGDTVVMEVAKSERGEDLSPAVSPDGRWIVYVSDESGREEVYLRPFPEVNRFRRQISVRGGMEPRWAQDGRTLYYRNGDDQLVAVAMARDGDAGTTGAERVLFPMGEYLPPNRYAPTYDVDRSGDRFILARRVESSRGPAAGHVVVIENFREVVRRLFRP